MVCLQLRFAICCIVSVVTVRRSIFQMPSKELGCGSTTLPFRILTVLRIKSSSSNDSYSGSKAETGFGEVEFRLRCGDRRIETVKSNSQILMQRSLVQMQHRALRMVTVSPLDSNSE